MISSTLLFLKDNPYSWGLISLATIILGMLGIRQSKKKRLIYLVNSYCLFRRNESTIDNLTIHYANEQIDSLSISKIALINNGNMTITNSDIAKAAPLKISVKDGCRILSVDILMQTSESNLFEVSIDHSSAALFSFDYMDKKDGMVLQVIHTGSKSSLEYHGIIKGGKISKPSNEASSFGLSVFKRTFSLLSKMEYAFVAISVLLILFATLGILVLAEGINECDVFITMDSLMLDNIVLSFWVPYLFVLFIYSYVWITLLNFMRKRKFILPKALRDFFQ